jgi:hypothetical protein
MAALVSDALNKALASLEATLAASGAGGQVITDYQASLSELDYLQGMQCYERTWCSDLSMTAWILSERPHQR